MKRKLDFKAINHAALNSYYDLVKEWLPDGRLDGYEYKSTNPLRNDASVGSFSINIDKGVWSDFATGDKGSDPVSLYAYLFTNNEQYQAGCDLADLLGIDDEHKPLPGGSQEKRAQPRYNQPQQKTNNKEKKPSWTPVLPAPIDAPEPPAAHFRRGKPEKIWRYSGPNGELLGYIYRFVTSDGGKEVMPLCWATHPEKKAQWRWRAFPEPRPLYGLDKLLSEQEKPILLVEGEKCADVGNKEVSEWVTLSWPGGGKAIKKADWTPLSGKTVYLWPDCDAQKDKNKILLPPSDQPGIKAMTQVAEILQTLGCNVHMLEIPAPGEKPSGWDIADAVEDGLRGDDLQAYINKQAHSYTNHESSPPQEASAGSRWTDNLLWRKGELVSCIANIYDILTNVKDWSGVLGFDEFSQRTMSLKPPPYGGEAGEWEASDDTKTSMWLTRRFGLTPSSAMVAEAIEVVAKENSFHPVRDWLLSLPPWDETGRTASWMHRYLGVPLTEYSKRISRWFLLGMVKRVMEPGCKFDYCIVLEGAQGRKKSTALSVLAGEWFGDTDIDLTNKDSMTALRGKWLYEFAEMGSVTRAESTRQKSFLSRQVDEFRPVYGRREIRLPRQVVFGGTTNEWEWNKDPTGGRRFWPVEVGEELDIDGLHSVREQLFAEALHRYMNGERDYPTPQEQKELFDPEQLKRLQPDGLEDLLHDWVWDRQEIFSMADAATKGLNLDASKMTRDMQTRIGQALKKLGCSKVEKRNGNIRYWYMPPQKPVEGERNSDPFNF